MVPNGWEVKSLDSVSKVIDCKHRTPKYVKEGVPLVSPGTIKWGALDLITPTKRVSIEEYSSLMDHCTVNVGDLVLSRNQSVGVASFVESEKPFVLGQDTVLIKPTEADSRFLFYNLQSVETQRTIFKLAGGSTFSRINLGDIRKLKAIYPPLSEQRKIAKILSTWDKAISTTERLIDNSKQQKKALMQQLLTGKKRLLDESGKPFEEEWEEVKLSQLVKVIGGNAFKSEEFKQAGIPLVKISNIKPDYSICLDSAVFISENDKFEKFKVKKGHVLIAMSGATTGKVGCYQSDDFAYLNQRVGRFDVKKNRTTNRYLFQLLKLPKVQHEILIDAVGGAQPNISNKDIERIKIYVPAVEEQKKIATVLSNADKEIELLEQQLADLKKEKKALMQQLLTGKRRVKTDDKEVA